MRIEFEKKSENRKYSFIVHLVEHEGYGTLHKLVYPLQVEEMQKVFFTHDMSVFKFNTVDSYILHVTGHMYPIVSNLELLSQNGIKYFLFLHVAPNYYLFKKEKLLFMDYLEYIQKKYGIRFFCPSENVANQYKRNGIDVECIQIGIEKIEKQTELLRLEPYYNKYVTVCTSSDFRYIALKGIDIFAIIGILLHDCLFISIFLNQFSCIVQKWLITMITNAWEKYCYFHGILLIYLLFPYLSKFFLSAISVGMIEPTSGII